MSIIEKNTLLRTSDSEGNGAILYPVTKLECVIGLEEKLENFVTSIAYLDVTLNCVPASTNVAQAGIKVTDSSGSTIFDGLYGGSTKRIEVAPDTSYTVSFTNPTGFSLGGDTFTFTTTSEYKKSYEFSETFYALYGFKIDEDEADPFERVSYFNDNANFSPIVVDVDGDGSANEGDWAAFVEHLVTPVRLQENGSIYCYLDRNNQNYKINGGTNNWTANTYKQCMVQFTKLWCRKSNDNKTFEYAFIEFPGSSCWAWSNGENTRADYIYMAMYKGFLDTDGRLVSYPFKTPTVSTTAQEEMDACALIGDGWYPRTHLMHNFLEEMTWLLGKSTDCQTTFGQGYTASTNTTMLDTGSTIETGAFYGSSDDTKDVKFLYIEGLWGNRWERISGMFSNVEEMDDVWVKPYPPFNLTAEGYTKQPYYIPSSNGYTTKLSISDVGNNFTDSGGSSSTKYCDYSYHSTTLSIRTPFVGGSRTLGSNAGVSYWTCYHGPSSAYSAYGCSPHYIPPVTE